MGRVKQSDFHDSFAGWNQVNSLGSVISIVAAI